MDAVPYSTNSVSKTCIGVKFLSENYLILIRPFPCKYYHSIYTDIQLEGEKAEKEKILCVN